MLVDRQWWLALLLLAAAAYAVPALAQQPAPNGTATAAGAAVKKPPKPKPAPAATGTADPVAAAAGGAKPTLLGQYGDWGAYTASPGGKKICFAIAKPAASETTPPGKTRNPSYMFISSRPGEKVTDEVSIIIGYPFKPNSDATVAVGSTSFALYTQQDGAWIKNAAEEARLIEAMRGGGNAVIKGMSAKGTRSTDTFSLKGLAQALDRTDQDCK
jgi:Invasion associated locus B (IalB) protein